MKLSVHLLLTGLLFLAFVSCSKPTDAVLTPEEQQLQQEQSEPLLSNEMLEHGGLRFKLHYPPGSAQIALKLYKTSPVRSEIPLGATTEFENYSIESELLDDNSDFILAIDYQTITTDAAFDLEVIGFTSMYLSKEFTVTNNLFTKANAGTTKDFFKIRKGIAKFTFYRL